METPTTVRSALAEVVLPEQIRRGELVIMHGKPFVIEHVQEVTDPWTNRPGLAVSTSDSTIVYLILTCSICGERAAMKYASSMRDCEWIEIRYQGRYHWFCPEHALHIIEAIASGTDV